MESRIIRLEKTLRERIAARVTPPAWVWISPEATEADLLTLLAFEDLDADHKTPNAGQAYKQRSAF